MYDIRMINIENVAYTAGYTDGDGCFCISKSKKGFYRADFYIVSTYKPVILFFKKTFGGSCLTKKRCENKPKDKTTYHFHLGANNAVKLAELLLPLLIEKRKQAKCFIEFYRSSDKFFKDQCITKMNTLKNEEDLVCQKHIGTLKEIKETKRPEKIDFSYIAGFIDAECSLGIYKHLPKNRINPKYKQTLQLGNTKFPCFEFFSRRFGGSFSFTRRKDGWNDIINYKLSSKKLKDLLPEIRPFLKNKKKVCDQLIKFNELFNRDTRCKKSGQFKPLTISELASREKIRKNINHLNTRGI